MSEPYTERDLRLAAKEVAAAMQQLYDDMGAVGAAAGKMIAIMDELGDEPMTGSRHYRNVDRLIGNLTRAYNQLVNGLQKGV